jgi:hypothetical protein
MTARNGPAERSVTAAMNLLKAAAPVLRPLLLAALAVLLILVGLPALLAAQAVSP